MTCCNIIQYYGVIILHMLSSRQQEGKSSQNTSHIINHNNITVSSIRTTCHTYVPTLAMDARGKKYPGKKGVRSSMKEATSMLRDASMRHLLGSASKRLLTCVCVFVCDRYMLCYVMLCVCVCACVCVCV